MIGGFVKRLAGVVGEVSRCRGAELRMRVQPGADRRGAERERVQPRQRGRDVAERVVDLLVADLQRRLADQDLAIELTPAARAVIAREGTDPAFGARPLKRTIQRLVENPFARALLQGTFAPGDTVTVDADPVGGTLVFSTAAGAIVADAATERRDARSAPAAEPAAAGSRGGPGGGTATELPETTPRKRGSGDLIN
jgi:hypothetical protein